MAAWAFGCFNLFLGLFDHPVDRLDRVWVVHDSPRPLVASDFLSKINKFLFHSFLAAKGFRSGAEGDSSSRGAAGVVDPSRPIEYGGIRHSALSILPDKIAIPMTIALFAARVLGCEPLPCPRLL